MVLRWYHRMGVRTVLRSENVPVVEKLFPLEIALFYPIDLYLTSSGSLGLGPIFVSPASCPSRDADGWDRWRRSPPQWSFGRTLALPRVWLLRTFPPSDPDALWPFGWPPPRLTARFSSRSRRR
jgi:hypothetical protein